MASADAHDFEISHVAHSAATGLVQAVVAIDVVVDEVDRGDETDGLSIGVTKLKNVCEDLRFKEILRDRLIVNPVSVAKDVLESMLLWSAMCVSPSVVGGDCFGVLLLFARLLFEGARC